MAGRARQRIPSLLVLVGAVGVLITVIVFAVTRGLGEADKLSSVIAGTVGLISLAGWAVGVLSQRALTPRRTQARTHWGVLRVSPDLTGFVAAQVRAVNAVPYQVPGFGVIPMAEIYVRQDLEARAGRSRPAIVDVEPRERLEARSTTQVQLRMLPVGERVEDVLGQHRHLLIEGGPGLGKSSLARSLTARIGRQWKGEPDEAVTAAPVVPVLVSARALSRHRAEPWTTALANACADELGWYADAGPNAGLFTEPSAGSCFLLLVDGLDEVTEPQRLDLLEALAERMAIADSPFRIVVLTRPLDSPARERLRQLGAGVYTMLPFSQAALEDFVAGVFGADTTGAGLFLDQLRSADLDEVAATPLLATIAVTVHASHPERGLPTSRYELYDQYLGHLRDVNNDRRRRLRARLRQRDPQAVPQIDALFDRTGELVEHLAVVQVESNASLVRTAGAWCTANLPPGPAAGRLDLIAEVLTSTGLLVRREGDLAFIHYTFAEHFAADRHAGALPPHFDPTAHPWPSWIDRAASGEDAARSVLIRWSRRTGCPDLIDWLQRGAQADNAVAAALIGGGATSADQHVLNAARYLDHICSTWTSDDNIERRLRRLPRGPALRAWALSVLDRDERPGLVAAAAHLVAADPATRGPAVAAVRARLADDPLPIRRALLARALAALGDPEGAVTATAAALHDDLATPAERGQVARMLMELGPRSRAPARTELHRALSATASAVDRAAVARILAELDPAWREAAASVVRAALEDPWTNRDEEPLMLGRLLAELGTEPQPAADALLRISHDVYARGVDRVEAARTAADLSPEHRRSAAAALRSLALDRWLPSWNRRLIVQHAADLGAEHYDLAVLAALSVLSDRTSDNAWQLRSVAQTVLRLPPHHREECRRALAVDPPSGDELLVMGAVARAILDRKGAAAAVETLQRIARDEFAGMVARHNASCMLCGIGPGPAQIGWQVLRGLARHDRVPLHRAYSAYWLAIEHPGPDPTVAAAMLRTTADPRQRSEERIDSATYQIETTAGHSPVAAKRLHAALIAPYTEAIDGDFCRERLAAEGRPERRRLIEACWAVADDPDQPIPARVDSCTELLRRRTADRRHAVEVLGALVRDPHLPAADRVLCASRLGLVRAGVDQAVAALTLLAEDPHTDAASLATAVGLLDRFGPPDRAARIAAIRALPPDPAATIAAVDWLGRVGAQEQQDADRLADLAAWVGDAGLLRSIARVAGPIGDAAAHTVGTVLLQRLRDGDADEAGSLAEALGGLGYNYPGAAVDVLVERLAETPGPADTVKLAKALLPLTSAGRRAAAEALEGLLGRGDVALEHLVSAVDGLASIAATAGPAAAHARRLLEDARLPAGSQARLAEIVTDLEPDDEAALDHLRSLLDDPATARTAGLALAAAEHHRLAGTPIGTAAAIIAGAGERGLVVAAEALARVDEEHVGAAVAVLGDAARCGSWPERWAAVTALTGLRLGRAAAVEALLRMLDDPGLTVSDQCRIAGRLAILGPGGRDLGAARMVQLLGERRLSARSKRAVAATLARFGPVYRDIAANHLQAADEPVAAAAELARLSPAYRRRAVQRLHAELGGAKALQAAATLAVVSPADRPTAAELLLAAAHRNGPSGVWAAAELLQHRHPGWSEAANRLRQVEDGNPAYVRRQAAEALLMAGRRAEQDALETLTVLSGDSAVPHHDRLEAALTLMRRADDAGPAIQVLQTLASGVDVPPTVRRRAAAALPTRAPARLDAAAAILRELAGDPAIVAEVRAHAAADLARLGPAFRDEGIARLDRQGDSAAARHLATLGARGLERALTMAGAVRINRLPGDG